MTTEPAPAARALRPEDNQFRAIRAHVRGTLIAAHQTLAAATGDQNRLPWLDTDDRMFDLVTDWLESLRARRP